MVLRDQEGMFVIILHLMLVNAIYIQKYTMPPLHFGPKQVHSRQQTH